MGVARGMVGWGWLEAWWGGVGGVMVARGMVGWGWRCDGGLRYDGVWSSAILGCPGNI